MSDNPKSRCLDRLRRLEKLHQMPASFAQVAEQQTLISEIAARIELYWPDQPSKIEKLREEIKDLQQKAEAQEIYEHNLAVKFQVAKEKAKRNRVLERARERDRVFRLKFKNYIPPKTR